MKKSSDPEIENLVKQKLGMWLGREKRDAVMRELLTQPIKESFAKSLIRLAREIFKRGISKGIKKWKKPRYAIPLGGPPRSWPIEQGSWDEIMDECNKAVLSLKNDPAYKNFTTPTKHEDQPQS